MSTRSRIAWTVLACIALPLATSAQVPPGRDALRDQGCLQCHNAPGGKGTAPDLAARLVPEYTVPALAATLWNHTPAMWAQVSATAMKQPAPTEAEWEGIFRQLYSLQFSDRPAVAARGKAVFESTCSKCHGLGMSNPGPGKPIRRWAPIADPIALIFQMWTHASSMKKAFAQGGARKLTGADFLDLTAYLRSTRNLPEQVSVNLPSPSDGAFLTGRSCGGCHGGSNSFAASLSRNRTLMEVGAATWNHITRSEALPVLSPGDFRAIVAYVWELQYRGPAGVASRGADLFERKGCISCHRSPTPQATPMSPRPGRTFTPLSMVALGWGSGREMHRQMKEKGVAWPHLSGEEVSHLVAFLNTLRR